MPNVDVHRNMKVLFGSAPHIYFTELFGKEFCAGSIGVWNVFCCLLSMNGQWRWAGNVYEGKTRCLFSGRVWTNFVNRNGFDYINF